MFSDFRRLMDLIGVVMLLTVIISKCPMKTINLTSSLHNFFIVYYN